MAKVSLKSNFGKKIYCYVGSILKLLAFLAYFEMMNGTKGSFFRHSLVLSSSVVSFAVWYSSSGKTVPDR